MKVVKIIGAVWIIIGICFVAWQWNCYRAQGITYLRTSKSVTVDDTDCSLIFLPKYPVKKTLIFFPGALVEPESYSPLMLQIAEAGYKVVLVKMPYRLAQFGYDKTETIQIFSDTTMKYCIAGHSKGAALASTFVFEKLAKVDGLMLIGTTHPRDFDLSRIKIPVLKIYGTQDGVADMNKVLANRSLLPRHAKYCPVEGGNHSQFAYYGKQLGDHAASISREQQQAITLKAILDFMERL